MPKPSRRLSVSFAADPGLFVPRPPAGGLVVGVVMRGAEIGALVRCEDGTFLKVNGDHAQSLNAQQVQDAVRKAGRPHALALPEVSWRATQAPASNAAPVVLVKKRRRIELPAEATRSASET